MARTSSATYARVVSTPLAPVAGRIAKAVSTGQLTAPVGTPAGTVHLVRSAASAGLVNGLNDVLLAGAIVSFVAAALCLVLIRQKDFVAAGEQAGPAAGDAHAGGRRVAAAASPAFVPDVA